VELNRVDLNLLVAFDALLSERSVTRAGERLHIGQSAMSATLARLRRVFDDPLLQREGRALVATPLAESLVKPVREVLGDIEAILAKPTVFDPATARRTFRIIASDYTMIVLLSPLLSRLTAQAPGIRLMIAPPGEDYVDRLRRGLVDLEVLPREAFPQYQDFQHSLLFTERFVCAVAADNATVGDAITLDQFSAMPYLASSCGHQISPAEAQLDRLGIPRNTEVTAAFGMAPILLSGTGMVALIHERLIKALAGQASLRTLEPPMPLEPIHQLMLWTSRAEPDPGHRWLRQQILAQASELHDQTYDR
jgi:DNA-binding transcriptional LysR family regulator